MNAIQEQTELGAAIHRAAKSLPHGWSIEIEVSKDGSHIALSDPDGERHAYPTNHERMSQEINDAIDYAINPEHCAGPVWQTCGDCDPCVGGRPDQCAIAPPPESNQ